MKNPHLKLLSGRGVSESNSPHGLQWAIHRLVMVVGSPHEEHQAVMVSQYE